MCISDSTDNTKDNNGAHWSLLLFIDRSGNTGYNFYSMNSFNKTPAHNLGVRSDRTLEMPCIQQLNSFECVTSHVITG